MRLVVTDSSPSQKFQSSLCMQDRETHALSLSSGCSSNSAVDACTHNNVTTEAFDR